MFDNANKNHIEVAISLNHREQKTAILSTLIILKYQKDFVKKNLK